VIGRLINGLIALASSISVLIETTITTQDNIFSFTIENQIITKIKKETYLTKDNIILVADLLANTRLARIYIALKSNKIRRG
jgi:hypothetical protein